jgi:hypothetical protein
MKSCRDSIFWLCGRAASIALLAHLRKSELQGISEAMGKTSMEKRSQCAGAYWRGAKVRQGVCAVDQIREAGCHVERHLVAVVQYVADETLERARLDNDVLGWPRRRLARGYSVRLHDQIVPQEFE